MSKSIKIDGRSIGDGHPVYIIAEVGANHNGDVNLAKKMIDKAKEVGVDCVKFQTYSTDNFCADKEKIFEYFSQGKKVLEKEYDMFKRLEFDESEWKEIINHCNKMKMPFITTVQDPKDLKMLLDIGGLKAIKVGSDDFDHFLNLRHYAESGLPLIISKGMANLAEVDEVIQELIKYTNNLAILHCVSLYPSEPRYLNIKQLSTLKNLYPEVVWGFSDHSQGTLASIISVGIGSNIIEKHFTLDHNFEGPDHWFSMNLAEMKELVEGVRYAESALGDGKVMPSESEIKSKSIMRRRIVARENLQMGSILNEDNVNFMRSSEGSYISDWNIIKGNRLNNEKLINEGINLSDINFN